MTDDPRKPQDPPPPQSLQTEGGDADVSTDVSPPGGGPPDSGMGSEGEGDPKRPGGMGGEG